MSPFRVQRRRVACPRQRFTHRQVRYTVRLPAPDRSIGASAMSGTGFLVGAGPGSAITGADAEGKRPRSRHRGIAIARKESRSERGSISEAPLPTCQPESGSASGGQPFRDRLLAAYGPCGRVSSNGPRKLSGSSHPMCARQAGFGGIAMWYDYHSPLERPAASPQPSVRFTGTNASPIPPVSRALLRVDQVHERTAVQWRVRHHH